jgi:hypothetical protein
MAITGRRPCHLREKSRRVPKQHVLYQRTPHEFRFQKLALRKIRPTFHLDNGATRCRVNAHEGFDADEAVVPDDGDLRRCAVGKDVEK